MNEYQQITTNCNKYPNKYLRYQQVLTNSSKCWQILKNSNELQSDLDEAITLEPFIFIRSDNAVANQLQEIDTFFDLTKN